MKKGIAVVVIMCGVLFGAAQAQLKLSLNVSAHPSPYLSDWASHREVAILTVMNSSGNLVFAKIHAKVTTDDVLQAETRTEMMPVLSIQPGVNKFYGEDIIATHAVKFYGAVVGTVRKTGMLPAGTYEICVELIHPESGQTLTQPACKYFSLTSYQLPYLQLPEHQKKLLQTDKPTFRWSPITPTPPGGARYVLKVFELFPGQSAANVLESGMPIFEREIVGQTQLLWPPDFIISDATRQYVWSVQSVDGSGNPLGDHDGWAEPFTFSFASAEGDGSSTGPKARLSGVLRDAFSNAPVANGRVVYHSVQRTYTQSSRGVIISFDESRDSLETYSDSEGQFTFTETEDSSNYSLRAYAEGYIDAHEQGIGQYQAGDITGYVLLLTPNTGSITGVVVDSVTGEGLGNTTVELWQMQLKEPEIKQGNNVWGDAQTFPSKSRVSQANNVWGDPHIVGSRSDSLGGNNVWGDPHIAGSRSDSLGGNNVWGDPHIAGSRSDSLGGNNVWGDPHMTASKSVSALGSTSSRLIATVKTNSSAMIARIPGGTTFGNSEHTLSGIGSFSFSNIDAGGDYYIRITEDSYRELQTGTFTVPGNGTYSAGTLKLQPETGTIEGWVKDQDSNTPIAGSMVYIYSNVGVSYTISNKYISALERGIPVDSLGSKYWNPAGANASKNGEFKGFQESTKENLPFIPASSSHGGNSSAGKTPVGDGKLPSVGTGGSGSSLNLSSSGLTHWVESSAWSPIVTHEGSEPPPMKPDSLALYGPVTTDENGYFKFTNVRMNDPEQITDQYAVWAVSSGYYDTYAITRLNADQQTNQVTLYTTVAKGIIYGTASNKEDGAPISNVQVELQILITGEYYTVQTAWTDADGAYTLYDIANGTYSRVRFSKTGIEEYLAAGPIEISNGTVIELNVVLEVGTGVVKGTVKNESGEGMPGVMIHSTNVGSISATSYSDGTYWIPDVPTGSVKLTFSQPGFSDTTFTVELAEDGDTTTANVTMKAYKGSIQIFVIDSLTRDPIQNATVTLDGTQETDIMGQVWFRDVAVGSKTLKVVADTAHDKPDYAAFSSSITIENGTNLPDTVFLAPGARISGTVTDASGAGLDSVKLTISGVSGVEALSGSDGSFTLRNVPAGLSLAISASKTGYINGKSDEMSLSAGEQKTGVAITLQQSPMLTLFGFPIEIESIADGAGGHKLVTGSIVDVPSNPVMSMASGGTKLPFENIEVDASYQPVATSYALSLDKASITVFGMGATMSGGDGSLVVSWLDDISVGQISGSSIVLDRLIPTSIPGSEWAEEKLTWAAGKLPPAFWSDGGFHTDTSGIGVNVTGSSVSAKLFGFTLSVNYSKSTIDGSGLHYYGSLSVTGLPESFDFEDLNIVLDDPSTGKVKFGGVTFKTTPLPTMTLGGFKFVDSSITFDEHGLQTKGAVYCTALDNRKFAFDLLVMSDDGWYFTIDPGGSAASITIFSQRFTISSVGMGKDASGSLYFMFSGELKLSMFDDPVEFESLEYTQEGDFTGTITFNQTVTFSPVSVQLQSLEFGESSSKQYLLIKGNIAFNIPCLGAQIGNFRVWEDGTFALEQIGFSFTAGPVAVSLSASWSDGVFEGQGTLVVYPVLSVGGEFRYGGATDWYIKISASVPPIPLGPFTITGIAGSLGRDGSSWIFGFGGTVSVLSLDKAIKLDLYVEATTTGDGPIIEGTADVTVMGTVDIGHAEITLDVPNDRFAGSIEFGWSRNNITISAGIDLEVKASEYWYVGGHANVNLFNIAEVEAAVYIGNNYTGYMHTFPATYHPDNTTLNGFHLDAAMLADAGKDGALWHLEFNYSTYVAIDWDLDLSGGISITGELTVEVTVLHQSVVGGSVGLDLGAAVSYSGGNLKFSANAGLEAKAWVWPCDEDSSCSKLCAVCLDISVSLEYASNSGWDWDVNW